MLRDPTISEPMSPPTAGHLTFEELRLMIHDGRIDTVIVAFPDMQGRLIGKRITGGFFLDSVHRESDACDYLLAADTADRHVWFKNGAKEIAHQRGKAISFMAKLSSALARADRAQRTWAALSLVDRRTQVSRMNDGLVARRDALALEITLQMGRPRTQTPGEIRGRVRSA